MVLPVIASLKNKLYLSINFLSTVLISFLLEKDPLFCQTWSNPINLRKLWIWSSKFDFISSPFNKLWKIIFHVLWGFHHHLYAANTLMKAMKQILQRDIFQLHFYKQELMNICLRQLETYKILCEFFQVKRCHMTFPGCDYLPLMLFSQNSGCMDSKSLNSIIILVWHMHRIVCTEVFGKMNDDWIFFLIIKSTLRALLLNSDIHLVKMREALIIIPRYLNSWTVSNASLSNTKWCFFIHLPLLLNIKIFVLSVLMFSFRFVQ